MLPKPPALPYRQHQRLLASLHLNRPYSPASTTAAARPRPPSLPSRTPRLRMRSHSVSSSSTPPSPTLPRLRAVSPGTVSSWPYRYVSTPAKLSLLVDAIHALPDPPTGSALDRKHIYLDSEGYELGTSVGKLSIVQLGLPNAHAPRGVDVFLVDILALGAPSVLRRLWDVLEDATLIKVVWDGKQDWAQLYHLHAVELAGVLDLQIGELLGRVRASERLRVAGQDRSEHRPDWIWSLGGMKRAVDDFKAFAPEERDGAEKLFHAVRAKFNAGGSSAWLDRPLTDELLRYAALDVYKLAALYPLFQTVRPTLPLPPAGSTSRPLLQPDDPLIAPSTLPKILTVSARSLEVHRSSRRAPDDPYHQHAFLPSEVLAPGTGDVRPAPCPGCKRTLHESSWQLPQSRVCLVCWAVEKRLSKRRGEERGVYSPGPGPRRL